jgi:hypothetical protein
MSGLAPSLQGPQMEQFGWQAVDSFDAPARTNISSLLPLLGIAAYVITSIFYVFPPGAPQPADLLLVSVIGTTILLSGLLMPDQPQIYLALGLFAGWIALVNVIWFFLLGDYTFLKKASFYIYNGVVFLFVITAGANDPARLRAAVYWSCIVAIPAEVLYLELAHLSSTLRAVGSFNNPNQLGYWALLVMASLSITKAHRRLGVMDVLALGSACYLIALSLSKAAILSGVLLVLITSVCHGWRRSVIIALLAALFLGVAFEVTRGGLGNQMTRTDVVSNLERRISDIGQSNDDSLLVRGYSRLLEHPGYLVFGAGEGVFDRLTDPLIGNNPDREFHSTLGNLLMSYGVVGLSFFLVFLFFIFVQPPWTNLFYLGPIMLYGITHNGSRETMLWIFLGLVFIQSRSGSGMSTAA